MKEACYSRIFQEAIASKWSHHYRVVPDVKEKIEAALTELVDVLGCDVVVTTGGTVPAKRDITPEATEAVCERIIPGFGERMRDISLWNSLQQRFSPGKSAE